MANTNVVPMPLWVLFSVPAAALSAFACLIAGPDGVIRFAALIVGMVSVAASFVVAPVAIYALSVNRSLLSIPQLIGTALCTLPILAMIASYLWGGI